VGKPVVLEEFGTTDVGSRYIVGNWLGTAYSSGLNGIQYWQFVGSFPSGVSSLFSSVSVFLLRYKAKVYQKYQFAR
jgi:hypothetical protein